MPERFVGRLVTAGVLCVALVACSGEERAEPAQTPQSTVSGSAADKAAVAQAFSSYRQALLAKDGKTVAASLTAESLEYFAAIRKLALTAPEPYLRRARMSDQLAVIFLRATVPKESIRSWSTTQLVTHSVRRGQLNAAAVERLSAGTVEVSGDIGTVSMKLDGKENPVSFTFYREGGRWKFRLIPLLEASESALRARVQEQHITERRIVDESLAATLSPEEIRAAWLPVG
ncbi:hypothetical protein [Kribbella sp. NPDC050459]|uniref:hypothetical protein n=1 Tax=Kribbella sp. NPDC050459 TaxID=3155785 RepID=UPI0033E8AA63